MGKGAFVPVVFRNRDSDKGNRLVGSSSPDPFDQGRGKGGNDDGLTDLAGLSWDFVSGQLSGIRYLFQE
jgi:hypothetical protein